MTLRDQAHKQARKAAESAWQLCGNIHEAVRLAYEEYGFEATEKEITDVMTDLHNDIQVIRRHR